DGGVAMAERLLYRLQQIPTEDQDWWVALLLAALDETGDLGESIILAQRAFRDQDTQPTSNVLNAGQYEFSSSSEKLEQFQRWLAAQMDKTVRGRDSEQMWDEYIQQGFRKGAGRSFDDVKKPPSGPNRATRPKSGRGAKPGSRRAKDLESYATRYARDQST